jgi:hypothetical protein
LDGGCATRRRLRLERPLAVELEELDRKGVSSRTITLSTRTDAGVPTPLRRQFQDKTARDGGCHGLSVLASSKPHPATRLSGTGEQSAAGTVESGGAALRGTICQQGPSS